MPARDDRLSQGPPEPDQRTGGQVDRDRILYSSEFRRLSGVTQVVSPGQEEIFHNRLTHTLKVAQIARRFAEHFCKHYNAEVTSWGGIDADVVEAAALAHDLGHPPFGHLAEEELNDCIREVCVRSKYKSVAPEYVDWKKGQKDCFAKAEGYEGNAQSFRIISRLAVRRDATDPHGLDLTRATLSATLKYPKPFDGTNGKYGCYTDDNLAFDFARDGTIPGGDCPSIEAQIMDWADDIAYSVHDVEDFYRAGLIPLDRLTVATKEREAFRRRIEQRWNEIGKKVTLPQQTTPADIVAHIFDDLIRLEGPYNGTRQRRADLYSMGSKLIAKFVKETKLVTYSNGVANGLEVPAKTRAIVAVLKELIWAYVIQSPALAAQQHGQREAIRSIFHILYRALGDGKHYLFPAAFQDQARELDGNATPVQRARVTADAVASLTDQQALRLFQRLTASSQGSVLDPIVR